MKLMSLGVSTLALIFSTGAALAGNSSNIKAPSAKTAALVSSSTITGDYLESRSLSVYAGACHYGGEAVTAGKEAVLAWRIKSGAWNGQNLSGLSVVAVVNGPENLAMTPAGHRTILYVDRTATPEQREAMASLLSSRYSELLGTVDKVTPAPVSFELKDKAYRVKVPGAVYVAADKYPCDKCVMPHQVWYSPFVPLKGAQVARALRTEVKSTAPAFSSWSKDMANSAYVGEFTL